MKKAICFTVMTVLLLFMLCSVSFAEEERCRCGRLTDPDGTCSECGRIPDACECRCWCGAHTVTDRSLLICERCGSVCMQCNCKDRNAFFRLNELSAKGRSALNEIPSASPIADTVLVGISLLCVISVIGVLARKKTVETVSKERSEKQTRKNHEVIMDKILSQESFATNPVKKSSERVITESHIKWKVDSSRAGVIAYELTNTVKFHGPDYLTVTDITLFSLGTDINPEATLEAAFKGSFGKTLENLSAAFMESRSCDGSTIKATRSYFSDNFFEDNEKSLSDILWDTPVDNSSIHQLLKLPFLLNVKVGGSLPQVSRFSEEKCAEYANSFTTDTSYLKPFRFSQTDDWKGGREI